MSLSPVIPPSQPSPSSQDEPPSPQLLRIGILGVAKISMKTAIAISNSDTSHCVVAAVASRSLEKANKFITDLTAFQRETNEKTKQPQYKYDNIAVYGGANGYDDLLNSTDVVDAVYIPLPTSMKTMWAIKALRSGKHVVIEKPVALSHSDLQELYDVAYLQNKIVLDGTMFPHHVRTEHIIKKYINNTATTSTNTMKKDENNLLTLGEINRLEANFTFRADDDFMKTNIRARKQNGDPHGCIGDLGWYCIRFALLVYNGLGIDQITSAQVVDYQLSKQHGVPIDATCVVRFHSDRVLWFHCSFVTPYRQRFEICGSKRSLTMDDLILPTFGVTTSDTDGTTATTGTTSTSRNQFVLSSSGLTKHDLLTYHATKVVTCDAAPVQEILLWKNFAHYARCIDKNNTGGTAPVDANPIAATSTSGWYCSSNEKDGEEASNINEANHHARMTMMNQRILDALMQSIEKNCATIQIVS